MGKLSGKKEDTLHTEGRCTLFVCTSCRPTGFPREPKNDRPGYQLYQRIADSLEATDLKQQIHLEAVECLSLCPRPCGIALSAPGSWTYLFGDQDPNASADTILECVSIYLASDQGQMPRGARPDGLRASILGRIPPQPTSKEMEAANE